VNRREIAVPFTDEEIERLQTLAAADGGSIADYIRACIFGPQETISQEMEDLTTMMARLEGARIRWQGRWRDRE
jgi:hypothetical protein